MEDWDGTQYFTDIIGLSSITVTQSACKSIEFGEKKRKIRAITPFKVIDVGTNRKPVCDFLLVINSNWHPISYRFGVIAAYCSNFGHCVIEPPFGVYGTVPSLFAPGPIRSPERIGQWDPGQFAPWNFRSLNMYLTVCVYWPKRFKLVVLISLHVIIGFVWTH